MLHKRSHKTWNLTVAALSIAAGCLFVAHTSLAVEHANIDIVDGNDPFADPPVVSIAGGGSQGTAGFNLEVDPKRGEFPIRIGADDTDDAAGGVLLGYVRESGRVQVDELGSNETLYATSATARSGGKLKLVAHRAGVASDDSKFVSGASFNANLASAYFPFSEGWLAGTAYNQFNGSILNELVASPGLTLGFPGVPGNFQQDVFGVGHNLLTLPGVTDARRQGLLFVNGAEDEGNYALSEPTADGSGFNVTSHDNATNDFEGEVDSVSFVFMPLNTPNVTMARVFARGHGTISNPNSSDPRNPVTMIESGSAITLSRVNQGEVRLSIAGESPSSGTLLVSPSGPSDGAGGLNVDNNVTYRADGNDWIILSQDGPNLNGIGQESGSRAESYFSFAFLPFDSAVTAPGPIQPVSSLTNFNRSRVIGWNAQVTQVSDGNSTGDMRITEPEQTTDVNIVSLFENKGDNNFAVDGAFLAASEGVMFATISEGLRDNSLRGGKTDYGVVGVSQTNDDEWRVHTGQADSGLTSGNEEFNVNFSVAFFGADSGFTLGQRVKTTAGLLDVTISGVDSLDDGVLLTTSNANNQANFVTANPRIDGSGWDVINNDNNTSPEEQEVNYVYLPFDAENLVAGRVGEDGVIAASTDTGDFSLTRTTEGSYLLTVDGKTPSDGMLLLTSTGEGGSSDNSLVYETSGNSFLILGIDMITEEESDNNGLFVDLEDTSFMFAYIDYDAPPSLAATANGDFDGDGDVDGADFLLWQRGGSPNGATSGDLAIWQNDFSTPPGVAAASAVPEPGSMLLLGLAIAVGNLLGFAPVSRSFNRN